MKRLFMITLLIWVLRILAGFAFIAIIILTVKSTSGYLIKFSFWSEAKPYVSSALVIISLFLLFFILILFAPKRTEYIIREDYLSHFKEMLSKQNCIVLYGLRQSGITSFLKHSIITKKYYDFKKEKINNVISFLEVTHIIPLTAPTERLPQPFK